MDNQINWERVRFSQERGFVTVIPSKCKPGHSVIEDENGKFWLAQDDELEDFNAGLRAHGIYLGRVDG